MAGARRQVFARVPVGNGAGVWTTAPAAQTVLVVVHSVTSLGRLLDLLAVLEDDFRVQVVFARIPASAFDDGVDDFLRDIGARVIPWEQAVRESFDLALSASSSGDLHLVSAPLIVMPHGIGYNKYLKTENGKRKTENGLRAWGGAAGSGWVRGSGCSGAVAWGAARSTEGVVR
ncbi:hypothetical protein [Actinomadura rupiterrae]|uniref:hypothetical protein n=1 Tax=Actinomadura rupiterrae TaxID=559627 RepID=UPI0020A316E2|nr:hypothetical protein [Actinomadura rupiterrae]MCP2339542.1 hypothetical protein [Actinomadura rupiterrae]